MNNLVTILQEMLIKLGVSKKDRLLLAVSGGLDSVVLTACCSQTDFDFGIAHANFQLRGPESDRDETFVCDLAKKYGKPFFIKKFNTDSYAAQHKVSIQVAARELRYQWFRSMLGKDPLTFQYLLTAHHLDDNIETMLMHFFRGTGISGLHGMPQKNEHLIRPFLAVPKSEIKTFAATQQLTWVEDSSNASNNYTRNYFRNQLIPMLENMFPDLHGNLQKNLQRFSEADSLYRQAIALYKKKLLKSVGTEVHIPILLLKKSLPLRSICFELIRDFNFSSVQTDELIRLMDRSNGKYISSPTHRIIKNRCWLMIAAHESTAPDHIIIDGGEKAISYPGGMLQIKTLSAGEGQSFTKDPASAWLDADKIHFPLILRKWKSGDYFYPLGMKKKKKLARFFIDQKLSKTAKEKVWVLVMDSQIIWVVGQRIDNRFCIRPATSQSLHIKNEGVLVRS